MFKHNFFTVSKFYTKAFTVSSLHRITNPITGLDHFFPNHVYTGLTYNHTLHVKTDKHPVFKNIYVRYIKTVDQLQNFYSTNKLNGGEFKVLLPLRVEEYLIEGDTYILGDVFGDNKKNIIKTYCKLRLQSFSRYLSTLGVLGFLLYSLDYHPDKVNFI